MNKKRILIVDDEPSFTTLTRMNLERANRFEVWAENQSSACVAQARIFQPDLIVLDVVMPGQDGGSVLAELAADETLRKIPVILLTATVTDKILQGRQGVFAGHPVLAKPIEPAKLIRQIEETLKQAANGGATHAKKFRLF